MNKALKTVLSVLLCACALAAVVPTAVYGVRGNLAGISLPRDYERQLAENAFENSADVRIMSSNLLVHYESWGGEPAKPRAKMYVEMIREYMPDVIGLQELCDSWYCCLKFNLPKDYKMLYPFSTGAFVRMTAMVYNSETLELIDSGNFAYEQGDNTRLRRVVWAVFRLRSTGRLFAVTNTHFDLIRESREKELTRVMKSQEQELSACIDSIAKRYDCPVYAVGDFNSTEESTRSNPADIPEIYNSLAEKYTDQKYHCKNQMCGSEQRWRSPTYDHIFSTSSLRAEDFCLMSYKWLKPVSDHYPVFADVYI